MLNFQRCPEPTQGELAINTPPSMADQGIVTDIVEHFHYWQGRINNSDTIGDASVAMVASQLFKLFGNSGRLDYAPREMRKYIVGLLAQSHLCRHLFSEEKTGLYDFDTSNPTNGGLLLEHGIPSRQGQPLDPRIHVVGEFIDEHIGPAGEEPSTWYRASDLYVHRTIPATPSVEFNELTERRGWSFDYSNYQTMFPYIARP